MLPSLLLAWCASPLASNLTESISVLPTSAQAQNPDEADYERRRKLADKDVDKMWDLYDWCVEKKLDKDAKSCLRRIVQLRSDDEKAHKLLGDIAYDGKWFPTEKKLAEYKTEQAEKAAKEEEKAAKEKGLVKFKDQWVTPEDLPFLQKGLVKNDKGEWIDPEVEKKLAEGWVKQDLEWIAPAEKENIAKGLWKCGDKWLATDPANEYHSELFQWWRIPYQSKFVLFTTCDRKVGEQVLNNLSGAYDDLVKCYGFEPATRPSAIILRDQPQYESFAAGDQEEGRPSTDSLGLSSTHYAYFADIGVNVETGEFLQWGVSYWDASTEAGPKFGVHSTRNALGQSFAEAVDPSPKAMEQVQEDQRFDPKEFWDEKKVPTWFRFGAAGYAERYYTDHTVKVGGNNRWAIEWSVTNLLSRGGMIPISQVLSYEPSVDKGEETQTWYNRVGLVMYFMIDGKCAPVTEKLAAFQTALKTGKDKKTVSAAAKALATELAKHDTDLRKFAGL
ncbi:MAG: hypothetical protein IPJ19_06300 [Planctomycetes bacterium]|nr:hypothetical protein [Planctomycetota bacterium]